MRTIFLTMRIWFFTSVAFGAGWLLYSTTDSSLPAWSVFPATIIVLIVSLPVAVILFIALLFLKKSKAPIQFKKVIVLLICVLCCAAYGVFAAIVIGDTEYGNAFITGLISTAALSACSFGAILFSSKQLSSFFILNHQSSKQFNQMETNIFEDNKQSIPGSGSNRIIIKAAITGVLILVMLIPTVFIANLVQERKARQAEVVSEVSNRWARAQVLTGPYIFLPYKVITIDKDKKVTEQLEHIILLPDNLNVNGQVSHELRHRSIYKVLLYRSSLQNTGNFIFKIPKEIDSSLIQWQDAKICYGLSDFKGIEEKLTIQFNGNDYELSPGLPANDIDSTGLSASVALSRADEGKKIPFHINLKIKGSEQLHFVPLAGDSRFSLQSDWASPSFDGSDLPSVRSVSDSGFTATWGFNKANLPFGTVLKDFKYDESSLAFGVTLIQPADGYSKTDRCVKYAILFIGLTFSLFFIIELMQKKPVHPLQYILIGLALIIFYTLLLSISEFIAFDLSYLIAAVATILLISIYAYGHFKKGKTAAIFGSVLTILYGFTFVLIRLEDTALLIGSIGLFIILALAMYASRKINWYGEEPLAKASTNIRGQSLI